MVHRFRFPILLALAVALIALALVSSDSGTAASGPPDGNGLNHAIAVQEANTDALMAKEGVVGTAVGLGANGVAAVVVFTEEPGVAGIPSELDGVAVLTKVTGRIVALDPPPHDHPTGGNGEEEPPTTDCTSTTLRFRPACIGISTGHPNITAGTIGARVKDEDGDVYALSNNHVYADTNQATIEDAVIQPGTFDGGSSLGDDDIGTLSDFELIKFDGSDNTIDAAIALSSTANLGNATPSDGYGTPKSATITAILDQKVKKYGRTTEQTKGRVSAINATVDVCYEVVDGTCTKLARFVDQIIIEPGGFSAGGDSGSLIVVDGKGKNKADDRKPVGLLFAGSFFVTVANPIDLVLTRFGVTIDGE